MFDHVIVGAGSAGCVLAARLTEDPDTRVLLLESGPEDDAREVAIPAAFAKLFKTEREWGYHTAPQPETANRPRFWPRGRMLGGSSSLNAMIYMRGNPLDYDGWAKNGCVGWSWDEVLPYFRRSEDNARGPSPVHGVGGPLRVSDQSDPNELTQVFLEAAAQAGIRRNADFNDGDQDGAGLCQVTVHRGRRQSAARTFLRAARRRDNLRVVTGAHVTRVLFDGDRATGVAFRKRGVEHTATARREVLLSGGAINSPQLLALSGIGPEAHLAEHGIDVRVDLPGVGANLQDHPVVACIWATARPLSLLTAESPRHIASWLVRGRGPLTSNVGEACAFTRTAADLPAPDIQHHFAPVYFNEHGLDEPTEHAFTIGPTLLTPRSVGHVELVADDPTAAPRIVANYLTDDGGEDVARLVAGVREAREIAAQPAFDAYRGREILPGPAVQDDDDALELDVRRRLETLYHPVGTCRMGVDDDAVVDPELRVRGVRDLRVVDASVMPDVPRGNTNAPTMMIAERAADLLRRD